MIVAAGRNGVIGVDGDLPWRIPGDLRRFKDLTMDGVVIMGRATFESIGRPLPGRTNIVMTRRTDLRLDGVVVVNDADAAIEAALAEGTEPIYVIGGAEVYRTLLPRVDRIDLTVVDLAPQGDTHLDLLDPTVWVCRHHREGEGDPAHRFHVLVRAETGDGLSCLPTSLRLVQSAS